MAGAPARELLPGDLHPKLREALDAALGVPQRAASLPPPPPPPAPEPRRASSGGRRASGAAGAPAAKPARAPAAPAGASAASGGGGKRAAAAGGAAARKPAAAGGGAVHAVHATAGHVAAQAAQARPAPERAAPGAPAPGAAVLGDYDGLFPGAAEEEPGAGGPAGDPGVYEAEVAARVAALGAGHPAVAEALTNLAIVHTQARAAAAPRGRPLWRSCGNAPPPRAGHLSAPTRPPWAPGICRLQRCVHVPQRSPDVGAHDHAQ